MGAILSSLRNASHHLPDPRYHEHVFQQLHPGYRQILLLSNGDAASLSVIDLCARLIALDKDLQIFQLQSSISNSRFKETTAQLKEQLVVLKRTIERTTIENEKIKHKLGEAEKAINALSTPSIPKSTSQSTSTSFSSGSNASSHRGFVPEDLIDLMDCSHESSSTKLTDEETTLHDEFSEDEPDAERASKDATPDQSLHQSSDWGSEGPSYIVRFANEDEDAKPRIVVNLPGKKVRACYDSLESVGAPQQQSNIAWLSETSDDSSPESLSSPSDPSSTAISFDSTNSEVTPVDEIQSKLINEGFSQLKALESKGSDLDKSMTIVTTLPDKLNSLGTLNQAEPSRLTSQPLIGPQDPQASFGSDRTEPRWNPEGIFGSSQDRKNSIWNNKRSAQFGERDVSCPDFFKYGIHYVPKHHELNLYRTVAISGLPLSVTMKALLEKVRGGMLFDVQLLETAKITGSNTALVTFVYEHSAIAYEDHARRHPIAFSNAFARVTVVPTPTWPVLVSLQSNIENLGHTRCLELRNIPRSISLRTVRQELTSSPVMKSDNLESMKLGTDGTMTLRFSSIRAAAYTSALLSKTLRYRGCAVRCIPDPCAQPLETLLGQSTNPFRTVREDILEPCLNPNAEAGDNEEFGSLTKVDGNIEPVHRRGRGFVNQAGSTTDVQPLRLETAATIAAFAGSFFCSE